jgi:hypothetical protein
MRTRALNDEREDAFCCWLPRFNERAALLQTPPS